ncbi:MAG TPA: hypothetical protein VMW64_06275 [Dehalococcoidia bacterium]|nr:hypothetical protein [Dehalococcoidia bacterium]
MKGRLGKSGIVLLALALCLSITGAAFAHWEKVVTIDGTVTTGNLNLVIISAADDDAGIDPGYTKDVADTTIVIDPEDPQRAIVTITNAYPSYEVYWHVTVRNVGTIPAALQGIIVTAPECITVEAWDSIGEQIDPYSWGSNYQRDNSGRIHVEQCAEQGATYVFTVEFVYWNWNEV